GDGSRGRGLSHAPPRGEALDGAAPLPNNSVARRWPFAAAELGSHGELKDGMQVVCSNCQLSFQAPEGAAGLVCPICRSPLRPPESAGEPAAAAPAKQVLDWSGGTLDDLVSLL